MLRSRLLPLAAVCLLATGCSSFNLGFFNSYKIDIQQGNVLTQDQVAQLRPGLTRDQVRFLLGTPMLTDVFHQQRWDYVYRLRKGTTGETELHKFAVYFDNDGRLDRTDGDVAITESTAATKNRLVDLGTISEDVAGKPLPPASEPGYFDRLKNALGF